MSKAKALFQKAWTAVTNPGQDERVPILLGAIQRGLQQQKGAFDLKKTIQNIEHYPKDVAVATQRFYEQLLNKYWAEGVPTVERQKTLAFVGTKLELKPNIVESLNTKVATVYFGSQLGEFLADGIVSDEELEALGKTSQFVGLTVPQFVQRHLVDEGLALMRGLFADATMSGYLDPRVWKNLLSSSQRLGITAEQLNRLTLPMARSFTEYVLADAKADGLLSAEEENYLLWILKTFQFDQQFSAYASSEIKVLKDRTKILAGNIDTIPIPPGINLNSGEILYFCQPSVARFLRNTQAGLKSDDHSGRLLLTESRLLFESTSKSKSMSYKSIVAWRTGTDCIITQVSGKPEITFFLPQGCDALLSEKFKAIIEMHSRVLRRKVEGEIDRHIPHDIRQRVWQRYGGKCAECSATEYLEFDHIIPVSRGGSNGEQNVQILCRKCNLSKSNKI